MLFPRTLSALLDRAVQGFPAALVTGPRQFLLGLKDEEAVLRGPMAGPLFETAVVAELAKTFLHRGLPPALWYWRSREGWEVDLLVELRGKLHPVEIKATATPRPGHADAVARWRELAGERAGSGLLITRAAQPSPWCRECGSCPGIGCEDLP